MDISIIIPVFNQAEILKITLEHFCAQMKTNENLQTEIIIVDDGSTDNIKQIVKRYVESENKIRIIYQKHQGRARARNVGVENALGERIIFSDADRIPDEDYINRHALYTKEEIVIGSSYNYYGKEISNNIFILKKYSRLPIHYKKLYSLINSSEYYWAGSLLGNTSLSKKTFQFSGGYDERFREWGLENIELGYRAFKKGIKIIYDSYIRSYHMPHKRKQNKLEMMRSAELFGQIHPEINGEILYQFYTGEITQNEFIEKIYTKGERNVWSSGQ